MHSHNNALTDSGSLLFFVSSESPVDLVVNFTVIASKRVDKCDELGSKMTVAQVALLMLTVLSKVHEYFCT